MMVTCIFLCRASLLSIILAGINCSLYIIHYFCLFVKLKSRIFKISKIFRILSKFCRWGSPDPDPVSRSGDRELRGPQCTTSLCRSRSPDLDLVRDLAIPNYRLGAFPPVGEARPILTRSSGLLCAWLSLARPVRDQAIPNYRCLAPYCRSRSPDLDLVRDCCGGPVSSLVPVVRGPVPRHR